MSLGDSKIIREEGNVRILEIECKYDKVSYCVIGSGATEHYDDYDDALEEFNLRWMKEKFG